MINPVVRRGCRRRTVPIRLSSAGSRRSLRRNNPPIGPVVPMSVSEGAVERKPGRRGKSSPGRRDGARRPGQPGSTCPRWHWDRAGGRRRQQEPGRGRAGLRPPKRRERPQHALLRTAQGPHPGVEKLVNTRPLQAPGHITRGRRSSPWPLRSSPSASNSGCKASRMAAPIPFVQAKSGAFSAGTAVKSPDTPIGKGRVLRRAFASASPWRRGCPR